MNQPKRINPSLDNAYARVRRANQHLTRLKRERTLFNRAATTSEVFADHYCERNLNVIIGYSRRMIPPIFGVLVGETIYNLRSALDYIIYELAILDSQSIQEGTQFPIEDSPDGWKRHRNYLKGLSITHKTSINHLQPYRGCKWTGLLRNLSNPDKHKTLTTVNVSHAIFMDEADEPAHPNLSPKIDVRKKSSLLR